MAPSEAPVAPPPAPLAPAAPAPADLLHRLDALRAAMQRAEAALVPSARRLDPAHRPAARNLAHYLAARHEDLRPLQAPLARLGLSSLGRMEGHALWTVDAVRRALARLVGAPDPAPDPEAVDPDAARARTEAAAAALFGPAVGGTRTRVMVTLPSEAATDPALVRSLVDGGMGVARVNCAHDGPDAWAAMARHVRAAARGRPVRVLMDLAGPKLRTGAMEPGPRVVHWAPRRDERGAVTVPARVAVTAGVPARRPDAVDAVLPVGPDLVATLAEGDLLELVDARGRERSLGVVRASAGVALALAFESAWVDEGTEVRRRAADGTPGRSARVGPLPAAERGLRLRPGDRLVLTQDAAPGRAPPTDGHGRPLGPATVPCTLPEVFGCVRPGESVWFDDGKIGGRVVAVGPGAIHVEIVHAKPDGSRLGADKGINLPDTRLDVPSLTPKDLEDLRAALGCADAVGLSFVDGPDAVHALWDALGRGGREDVGVVVKVETRRGFARLPEILLASMAGHPAGVMIARGDLAVECGFERLAEVQEEILWLAEAAHVPVVWATQVLETAAKTGRPTRAEITDAAMACRAECVMLNKGPHLPTALRVLRDVLARMEQHQDKKSTLLRALSVSGVVDGTGLAADAPPGA